MAEKADKDCLIKSKKYSEFDIYSFNARKLTVSKWVPWTEPRWQDECDASLRDRLFERSNMSEWLKRSVYVKSVPHY